MCSQNILFWKPISGYFSIIQNLLHAMTIKIIIINSHKPRTKIHTNNPQIQLLKCLRKSLGVYNLPTLRIFVPENLKQFRVTNSHVVLALPSSFFNLVISPQDFH